MAEEAIAVSNDRSSTFATLARQAGVELGRLSLGAGSSLDAFRAFGEHISQMGEGGEDERHFNEVLTTTPSNFSGFTPPRDRGELLRRMGYITELPEGPEAYVEKCLIGVRSLRDVCAWIAVWAQSVPFPEPSPT